MLKKSKQLHIRLEPELMELIEKRLETLNTNKTDYLRQRLLLKEYVVIEQNVAVEETLKYLQSISNNINQIARALNTANKIYYSEKGILATDVIQEFNDYFYILESIEQSLEIFTKKFKENELDFFKITKRKKYFDDVSDELKELVEVKTQESSKKAGTK